MQPGDPFSFLWSIIKYVPVYGSVLSLYEGHQKLLQELRGTKREAENG